MEPVKSPCTQAQIVPVQRGVLSVDKDSQYTPSMASWGALESDHLHQCHDYCIHWSVQHSLKKLDAQVLQRSPPEQSN
eukprot:Gb_23662 [translate_table: standard]